MSIDYAIWKPNPQFNISRGLGYLLLVANIDAPELMEINVGKIEEEFSKTFPAISNIDRNGTPFYWETTQKGILLQSYSDTPDSIVQWFVSLAKEEGYVFFDPQREKITKEDESEIKRRETEVEVADDRLILDLNLPDLVKRSESGDGRALFLLGNSYFFGEGVAKNLKQAFKLYQASALAGNIDGMHNLASCYRLGDGTNKNIRLAIQWYSEAAKVDKFFAAFELGEIYMKGEGVQKDSEKATEYYKLSLESGNTGARKPLRELGVLPPL